MMSENPEFDYEGATELHNRLAEQIVAQIVAEPIAAGGNLADVMILCESVLFGVIMGCFSLGSDVKALDIIVGRVKERLATVRMGDVKARGRA
jgi:hypothetical protein